MTTYPASPTYSEHDTTGAGWIAFAATMMGLAGAFGIIAGLVALFRDQVFLVVKDQLIVSASYTAWGWVHLGVGALLLLACASLFQGHMYGRVVAVLAAAASALVNLAFLPAYPLWAAMVIALDVAVIFAVTVHGRALQD